MNRIFAGEAGGEAVLPALVFARDLAFGLRRWGVAEGVAVEVKGLTELGGGGGGVGEEAGMEVHAEFERPAVFENGGGVEVVIGEAVFVLLECGAGEEAFAAWEPAVRRGLALPEFADLGARISGGHSGAGSPPEWPGSQRASGLWAQAWR